MFPVGVSNVAMSEDTVVSGNYRVNRHPSLIPNDNCSVIDNPCRDRLSLSDDLKNLSRTGLDADRSFLVQTESRIDFQLAYIRGAFQTATASGWYSEEQNVMHASMSLEFQQTVVTDEGMESRIFELKIEFTAVEFKSISMTSFEEKEDILDLVRRLIEALRDVVKDDEKILSGVIFDFDDYRDVVNVDEGRLLKTLESLVRMIVLYTRLLAAIKGEKDTESVVLHPERRSTSGVLIEEKELNGMNFKITVRECISEQNVITPNDESPKNITGKFLASASVQAEDKSNREKRPPT
jgi:hypothetical protein